MKKLFFVLSIFFAATAYAQNYCALTGDEHITSVVERILEKRDSTSNYKPSKQLPRINIEFAGSANAYFTEGKFDEASFKMNRVRFEILGALNDNLSYHFRQAFNKLGNPASLDNITSSIEYAYLTWHTGEKFDLVAGKQCLAVAGYENWINGLKVREFSVFNDSYALFQTGITGVIKFTPTQHLYLQVANNKNSYEDGFAYGLPSGVEPAKIPLLGTVNWTGWFADNSVMLMYSASAGQQAKGKNLYYLMCGNVYEKKPFLAYLDVLYARAALDSQCRIIAPGAAATAQNTQYLTLIANLDYQFHPKWNAFVKGAYETVSVYKTNDAFEKGRYVTSWNAQACLEWFPLSVDKGFKVFAHYVYKAHALSGNAKALGVAMPHTQRVSLGIQYIIPVM